MAYLSLETFEKTDKESRQQARNAFRTEDPSTERLYWAIPNMRDNEKWRSRMSKKAQKLYEKNRKKPKEKDEDEKEEEQQETSEKIEEIKQEVKDTVEECYEVELEEDENKHENHNVLEPKKLGRETTALSSLDHDAQSYEMEDGDNDDIEFELDYDEDEEELEFELEEEIEDVLDQSDKSLEQLKKDIVNNDYDEEEKKKEDDDEESKEITDKYEQAMDNFIRKVADDDITTPEGLNSIEDNLKCAVKLLVGGMAKRQLRMLIKPADIQNLLTTFQNLRKTQWDNQIKYLPNNLDPQQQQALMSIYKMEFLDAYEREARKFLSGYDYDLNKPRITTRLKNKIKAKADKLLDKFTSKMDFKVKEKFDDMKDKLKAKFAKKVEEFDEVDNDNDVDQEDIPVEEMAVPQKVLDLVAVTLRPKTTKDGTAKENTYGEHYNELKSIMDEYIEDDDYPTSSSSSVKLELKAKDPATTKCFYTLYAVLVNYAEVEYNKKENILERDKGFKKLNDYDHKFFEQTEIKGKEEKFNENFVGIYNQLIKCGEDLYKGNAQREKEVLDLLEQFSGTRDKSFSRQMFQDLISDNKIMSNPNHEKYFANLKTLKDQALKKAHEI